MNDKGSEFIAPNSQRAIDEARVQGLDVVFPMSNEAQLDIDSVSDYNYFTAQIEILLKREPVEILEHHSRSSTMANPKMHITLKFKRDLSNLERLVIQACLGSDRKRELLSYFQELDGDPHPTLFLEKSAAGRR